MAFSAQQLQQYQEKGYIISKGLLAPKRVQEVAASYLEVENLDTGRSHPFFHYEPSIDDPKKQILRRIERVSDHSDLARDLIYSTEILSAVGELLGEKPVLFKDKLNLKLPGGSGYRAHLDGHFHWTDAQGERRRGWAEYADTFLNVVLPLDPSKVENGCLEVSPLDEMHEVFGHGWDALSAKLDEGGHIKEEEERKLSLVPLETEIGDVIFFDWRNPHRSGENRSTFSRRILYATYNKASAGDFRDLYYRDRKSSQGSKKQKSLLQ